MIKVELDIGNAFMTQRVYDYLDSEAWSRYYDIETMTEVYLDYKEHNADGIVLQLDDNSDDVYLYYFDEESEVAKW